MGQIFYILGKSATGKDSLYKSLRRLCPRLRPVIPYTTRPIREGEQEGVEYHFTTEKKLDELRQNGNVIEMRTYQTIFGPWSYATVQDGQIDLKKESYLMIGTLESYLNTRSFFGEKAMVPLYIHVEDGERLSRALARERQQKSPRYAELCRRFLADEEDFKEEKLRQAGIGKQFENDSLEDCLECLVKEIERYL